MFNSNVAAGRDGVNFNYFINIIIVLILLKLKTLIFLLLHQNLFSFNKLNYSCQKNVGSNNIS